MDNDGNRRAHGRSLTDLLQKINQITWAIAAGFSAVAGRSTSEYGQSAWHTPITQFPWAQCVGRSMEAVKRIRPSAGIAEAIARGRHPQTERYRSGHSPVGMYCAPLLLEEQRLASAGFRGRTAPMVAHGEVCLRWWPGAFRLCVAEAEYRG